MRLIYMDEAGTSASEPTCVVSAVIVHGDDEFRLLENELKKVINELVPDELKNDLYIHATEVFSGGKKIDRNKWPFEDRLDFIKAAICLPFVFDIPLAFGIVEKDTFTEVARSTEGKATKSEFSNVMAFALAAAKSDEFLRRYLHNREIATVIAEDNAPMRTILQTAGLMYRDNPEKILPNDQLNGKSAAILGIELPSTELRIDCIIDTPHFVKKGKAPLLQIADLCAFAMRRCLVKKDHGADLVKAMLGPTYGCDFVEDPVWFSGTHAALFNTTKYWTDEERESVALAESKLEIFRLMHSAKPEQ